MPELPRPSAASLPGRDSSMESAMGMITILIHDWAPGRSEIRMKLPPEAKPGQPKAMAEQSRFRARVIADLDDALRELGDP